MTLMSTQNAVILVLIVLAVALVGIALLTGRLNGFLLYPAPGRKLSDADEVGQATQVIGSWILLFGIVGFLAVGVSSCGAKQGQVATGAFWQMLGTDTLIALASAAVGGLLGFLFGIPRTIDPATGAAVAQVASQATEAITAARGDADAQAARPSPRARAADVPAALAANTNLERISDWLTTLLIGATLAQSGPLATWIGESGTRLGAAGEPVDRALIPIVIVYFLVLGFLGVYLITRLYLTLALQRSLALMTGRLPPGQVAALLLVDPALPDGQVGLPYTATLRASGGVPPYEWSVDPALPDGLGLAAATGIVSGTPTRASAGATYAVTVTDGASPARTASVALGLSVAPA